MDWPEYLNPKPCCFKYIEIEPRPVGDITFAEGKFNSPYGMIRSAWKKDGDNFEITGGPCNTRATAYLPAARSYVITENPVFENNPDVRMVGLRNGKAGLRLVRVRIISC
jgi:hypothetical protein